MAFLFRLDATSIVVWIAILGAVVGGLALAYKVLFQGKKSKRIKAVVSQRRGELSRQQLDGMNRPSSIRQRRGGAYVGLAQKLLEAFKLQNLAISDQLKMTLAQAGFRGRNAITVYLASRIVGAVCGFMVTLVVVGLAQKFPYPDFVRFLIAGAGAGIGFFLPKVLVTNNIQGAVPDNYLR